MKIRIGIIFGGFSREREISFAGGRTVYDNLDKGLFEAVPIFVDSFGNFVLLNWENIYKGSIRDFYPPAAQLPQSPNGFQVYAESLGNPDEMDVEKLIQSLGKIIPVEQLKQHIDFAFLCLHGPYGEDGRIQGLLEYRGIPYSGSGIYSSSIGINKAIQKKLLKDAGFACPSYFTIRDTEWQDENLQNLIVRKIKNEIGFPAVIKSANQGSSIGVSILNENSDEQQVREAIDRSFFLRRIRKDFWTSLSHVQQVNYMKSLCDIREGIGIPVKVSVNKEESIIYHPENLLNFINQQLQNHEEVLLQSLDCETEVVVESFIEGKEFSCIVIRNEDGLPVALPPTEIRKGKELFDYRSKYLPGLSRKITPIQLPDEQIRAIRKECERLFVSMRFNVYARIDGFVNNAGQVFLNDPNTTSGMMPSSFFFHQAAEIGLNPSQFLTYIIRTSLIERKSDMRDTVKIPALLAALDQAMKKAAAAGSKKLRVAVILGGFSSERHISVESGRNIYEKLSSSSKYLPFTVFLSGNEQQHELYQLPVNLLLKDNADDILEKIKHFSIHPVIAEILEQCSAITRRYTGKAELKAPLPLTYDQLAQSADACFIALHGRPGEDGAVQMELEKVHLPYNGSGTQSSRITINKYETNEILRKHGLLVAQHDLVHAQDWQKDCNEVIRNIEKKYNYPFIAKPVDDGCSSAVKKINSRDELSAFAKLIFRQQESLFQAEAQLLNLKAKEEFPKKNVLLIEELISKKDAEHFLEITGGLLTRINDRGERYYEIFEASEALSEGDVLSLEEKFLAGEGQNITPARYHKDPSKQREISDKVKLELLKAAELLNVEGYARIDAFVRIFADGRVEVIFVEVNSLPGMTPATCIFHQSALQGYKPYDFIDHILEYGMQRIRQTATIS